jgi:hypothetical protein
MRSPVAAWLAVAALLGGAEARAEALRLALAVPVPLAVYGYLPEGGGDGLGGGGGSGGGLDFLGGLALSLEGPPLGETSLRAGLWAEGLWVRGSEGGTSADVYLVAAGAALGWLRELGGDATLRIAAGPAVVASGIVVDAAMRLDTWALGGRAEAGVAWTLGDGVSLGPWASLLVAGPPLDASTWFNKPLGGTRVLQVGVALSLGDVSGRAR